MFLEDIKDKWKCVSVNAKCDECGIEYKAKISTALKQESLVGHHQCRRCSSRRAGKKTGEKMREVYSAWYSGDGNPAKKPGVGERISAAKKGVSFTKEHKEALCVPKTITDKLKKAMRDPKLRKGRSERMKANPPSKKPEVRELLSKIMSEKFAAGGINYQYKRMKTGWISNSKTKKPIWCRSGLEMRFLEAIDNCSDVISVESAENIRIKYQHDGVEHSYLPDFKIVFDDNSAIIVEIKGTYFALCPKWQPKLKALDSFCEKLGINYLVLNEKEEKKWLELLNDKR